MRFAILIWCCLDYSAASGQLPSTVVGGYHSSIPDPQSDLSVFSFASNKSVAKEIGLNDESLKSINKLISESDGSLANPGLTVVYGGGLTDAEWKSLKPSGEQIKIWRAARIIENEEKLNSILSQGQRDRLRQIIYWIEISRVGLTEALIEGFLGKNSGIEDHQTSALKIRAETIEAKAAKALKKIRKETLEEFLKELTAEQVESLQQSLGEEFIFRNVQNFEKCPNPESASELLFLIKNVDVANELRLNESEQSVIGTLLTKPRVSRKGLMADELKRIAEQEKQELLRKSNEILDPNQVDRLKQIGYQLEISKIGLGTSLTEGHLSKKVQMTETQKQKLRERLPDINRKENESIVIILNSAFEEFLSELHPLQRGKVKKLLGNVFVFQE